MDSLKIMMISGAFFLAACNSTPQSTMTNDESSGNLQTTKSVSCVSIAEINNNYTPVDMFNNLRQCLTEQNYQNAAELYIAALSYGYFDIERVADKTAHQAISVLRMNALSERPQSVTSQLKSAINAMSGNNHLLCQKLEQLGAPAYMPSYMLQHGVAAFTGQRSKDGLVDSFSPSAVWQDALEKVAKCD
ncbi:hypothetical protein JYB87_11140 [Shewanella avicenniae]|uniref:Uncharacterized protein n=1 Tax=Shewanella avicenniae TaxID=2814294 RepID=A0ABX7QLJ9_9GAMM|nr:hypothetical protein [Shewanella avicenniae]QSX32327.1 hypothetical protein JYB87_11140 [Shewanella avicenniae]